MWKTPQSPKCRRVGCSVVRGRIGDLPSLQGIMPATSGQGRITRGHAVLTGMGSHQGGDGNVESDNGKTMADQSLSRRDVRSNAYVCAGSECCLDLRESRAERSRSRSDKSAVSANPIPSRLKEMDGSIWPFLGHKHMGKRPPKGAVIGHRAAFHAPSPPRKAKQPARRHRVAAGARQGHKR
jgi:hypothetical protein